jgi:glycosyltransferase involved in cell wall biosynthesis
VNVSVIIPSFNEATYINRLLGALSRQNFKDFEVIVSDAESKDKTSEVVDEFSKKLDLKFVQSPPKGPAAGRNVGARLAHGDWLLFLDADDDIDDLDFIKTLVDEAAKNKWSTATTDIKVKDASLAERFGVRVNYKYIRFLARTKHPVAPGWCILTKRSVFEEAGGFNEKIQFGEDYDYVSRTGKHGFGFVEKTYYFMDLRRSRAEGFKFVVKGTMNEIYRHTHHYNLEKNPIKYEFGHHEKRK